MSHNFFESKLVTLKNDLTKMGGAVEIMLAEAMTSFNTGNIELAQEAILRDKEINRMEVNIVDQTVLLIATNQPVAGDLRFLAASLRMASELERAGDIAANLARRGQTLAGLNHPHPLPDDLVNMLNQTKIMFSKALDAFARYDLEQANGVLADDDLVDDLNRKIRRETIEAIALDGSLIYWGLEIIQTASHLERLADHATNLAEEIIYIASGQNIRHKGSVLEAASAKPAHEN